MKKFVTLLFLVLFLTPIKPFFQPSEWCKIKETPEDHAKCAGVIIGFLLILPTVFLTAVGVFKLVQKIADSEDLKPISTNEDEFDNIIESYEKIINNPKAIKEIINFDPKNPDYGGYKIKGTSPTDLWDYITSKYELDLSNKDFDLIKLTVNSLDQFLKTQGYDLTDIHSLDLTARADLIRKLIPKEGSSDFLKIVEEHFDNPKDIEVYRSKIEEIVNKLRDVVASEIAVETLAERIYDSNEEKFKIKKITLEDIKNYLEKNPKNIEEIQIAVKNYLENSSIKDLSLTLNDPLKAAIKSQSIDRVIQQIEQQKARVAAIEQLKIDLKNTKSVLIDTLSPELQNEIKDIQMQVDEAGREIAKTYYDFKNEKTYFETEDGELINRDRKPLSPEEQEELDQAAKEGELKSIDMPSEMPPTEAEVVPII